MKPLPTLVLGSTLGCLGLCAQQLPRLVISSTNQNVWITWPATNGFFLLQSASALSSSNWQASTLTPVSNASSGTFSVSVSASNLAQFFRLTVTNPVNILLSTPTQLFHFGQPDAMGLYNVPDQHLALWQQSSNSYRVWITGNIDTNVGSAAMLSTTDFVQYANAGPGSAALAEAVFTPFPGDFTASTNIDADYVGPNAVITASNGRDLLMFYEAGNKTFGGTNYGHSDGEFNVIALARSTNHGLSWTREGAVLSGPDLPPTSPPGTSQPGLSEPGLLSANGYLYMFFQYVPNQTNEGAPSVIQMARAPLASDGVPNSWFKYYTNAFASPGLLGPGDAVVPTGTGTGCTRPVEVWPVLSTYLNAYVLLFVCDEGWFFSTSHDLVTWTEPMPFLRETMWQHCQPMDWNFILVTPGNPPGIINQTGYVLYAHTDARGLNCPGGFSPHELWMRPFTFLKFP